MDCGRGNRKMSSKLPSGFKTRKEYNAYMRAYNKKYRLGKKKERQIFREHQPNRLAFLEWENQRLTRMIETLTR